MELFEKSNVRRLSAAALGVALLGVAGCSSAGGGAEGSDTYSFTFASAVAETHPAGQASTAWMERVEDLTDGRVTFQATWSGALLPGAELLAAAGDGRADIVHTSASWHLAELPLTSVATMPFINLDGEASTRALNEMYESSEALQSEFEAQRVELISAQPLDVVLLGGNAAYEEAAALSGQQIRATGEWVEALTAVGAEAVGVAYAETYEALERGLVDGYALNWEGVYDLQLHEVAAFMEDPGVGQISNMMMLFNDSKWEALPEDIRSAFDQATEEQVDGLSELYAALSEEQCAAMVEHGTAFSKWTESAAAEWRDQVAADILQSWTDSQSDPVAAQAFLDEYQTLMDERAGSSEWRSGIDICLSLQDG
jgi:TRAP-type C4-dicarboxylate transport system substrate-binding protein